ncbi:MAG TPA: PHP domain-containing protein, partial [Solirubrobacteraceae bacterium]|nr:PHP domain-containing protein [Solirubrobacteraceae bacterium]
MPPRFDLQSHSTHSDGALPAAEVVRRAADAGVQLLALSDHDTVSGVSEAIAAGEGLGVRVVPAVEISAIDASSTQGDPGGDGGGTPAARELHILGYCIEHTGAAITAALADFLSDREKRTLRMRDALREVGFELDEAEIDARIAEGKPIGRPHLAGAVLRASANAERLKAEGIDDVGS